MDDYYFHCTRMILVFHLVSFVISASMPCAVSVANIGVVLNGLGTLRECIDVTFRNTSSDAFRSFIDTNYLNPTEDTRISVIDGNYTLGLLFGFIASNPNHDVRNAILYINNTVIRRFSAGMVRMKRIVFTDCVINMTEYTPSRSFYLGCGDMQFNNCTFVGKRVDDESFIRLTNDDKIAQYNLRFIDCRFDMDRDWRGSEITGYKNFIFVEDQQGRFVQIDFTRCIGGYDIGTSVKLIKMSNKEVNSENIIIQSSNSGIEKQTGRSPFGTTATTLLLLQTQTRHLFRHQTTGAHSTR